MIAGRQATDDRLYAGLGLGLGFEKKELLLSVGLVDKRGTQQQEYASDTSTSRRKRVPSLLVGRSRAYVGMHRGCL